MAGLNILFWHSNNKGQGLWGQSYDKGKGFLSEEARLFWLVFGAVLFYLE